MASCAHSRHGLRKGRSFLADAASCIVATDPAREAGGRGEGACSADPAVSMWRDWLAAHRLYRETCRRRQRLEAEMLGELGRSPCVKIVLNEDGDFRWASTTREIDRLLPNPEQTATRRKARSDLATRHGEWNLADRRIGYSRARKAEVEISTVEQEFARQLWQMPARSAAGVAAKLHCLLEIEDPTSGLHQEPWPQLRAILSDLVRLGRGTPQ